MYRMSVARFQHTVHPWSVSRGYRTRIRFPKWRRGARDPQDRFSDVPPPPPPPPAPSPPEAQERRAFGRVPSWPSKDQWLQIKEMVRPYLLYAAFTIGFLTFGLDTANKNFDIQSDPFGFIASAAVSGGIIAAVAWVTFNFEVDPPADRRF